MNKLSIVIPVYFNEDNLVPMYEDLKEKVLNLLESYELIFVDDGSEDNSYSVLLNLAKKDENIRAVRLSRNFGSGAAILAGFNLCTGSCAVVKAADMQEPSELVLEMYDSWKKGNDVVLAVRDGREDAGLFANIYYWLVQKFVLPNMPKGGFDAFLLDRKVLVQLERMSELNSSITGQILWSGHKTAHVHYVRRARSIGKSRWTMKKKIRLFSDTFFSFSNLPFLIVNAIGVITVVGALIWAITIFIGKLIGNIDAVGWTSLFILNLFSFGVIMLTLGILGGYIWRTFDAARNRPAYIVELDSEDGPVYTGRDRD